MTQEEYFAQNPNAGFGDFLNFAQGKTPGGAFQAPSINSLPGGFMQSEYGGPWQGVLEQFNDPNYNRNEDPNNLAGWLANAPIQFSAGRSLADWGKPSTSADYGLTNAAIQGTAAAFTGGLSGPALNAVSRISPDNPTTRYTGGPATIGGGAMPTYGTNMPQVPGLFDNLLGTVGNLSPAILAGYLGNSQRQDVMGQVGRLNDVAGCLTRAAIMQSISNPYD